MTGFEPVTTGISDRHSDLLSYIPNAAGLRNPVLRKHCVDNSRGPSWIRTMDMQPLMLSPAAALTLLS